MAAVDQERISGYLGYGWRGDRQKVFLAEKYYGFAALGSYYMLLVFPFMVLWFGLVVPCWGF